MKASLAITAVAFFIGSAYAEEYQAPDWTKLNQKKPETSEKIWGKVSDLYTSKTQAEKQLPKMIKAAQEEAMTHKGQKEMEKYHNQNLAKIMGTTPTKGKKDEQTLNLPKVYQQYQAGQKKGEKALEELHKQQQKANQEKKQAAQNMKKMISKNLMAKTNVKNAETVKPEKVKEAEQSKEEKAASNFMKKFQAKQEETFKNAATSFKKAQETHKKEVAQKLQEVTDSIPGHVANLKKKADHVGAQGTKHIQDFVKDGYKNLAKIGHSVKKGHKKEQRRQLRDAENLVDTGGLAFDKKHMPKLHSGPLKGHRAPADLPALDAMRESGHKGEQQWLHLPTFK